MPRFRAVICFAVNMIANGKFYHAGVPMPLAELAAIPPNLRKREFIIRHSNLEPEPDDAPRSLTFQLNTAYAVDEDGNRRQARHLQRQAAQLEAIEDQESAIVEELQNANDDLDPAIAAQIQDAHDSLVQRQIAEGQAAARQCEIDEEAARQFIAEQDQMLVDDVSPTTIDDEPIPEPAAPKPRKLRKRYLRRGNTWLRAMRVSCRVGEAVYVREAKGKFLQIGVVGSDGKLPVAYLEEIR